MVNPLLGMEKQRWEGFLKGLISSPPESNLTPRTAIWKKNKATLWYYPASEKKYKIPLFLVYSMVNQPFILDLGPGVSVIEGFVQAGFDVYLIDFGIPGYEDKDSTLNDYVTNYIQKGVRRALYHSNAEAVTVIGYCIGGTLAAMYAAIAEEPIKNLILTVAPFEFSAFPIYDKWIEAVRNDELHVDPVLEALGLIPAPFIEAGVRMITAPVYYSHYLSLLSRADDPKSVEKWQRFNHWTTGHIPFPGAAAKQLMDDFIKENKFFSGKIQIEGKNVDLGNVQANLLVIASKFDRLVPQELILPIMDYVASPDKTYHLLEGGHAGVSLKGGIPAYLKEWIHDRSEPIF
ncbi:alpha/beta fold hydrolase [Neobacillus sp. Marseille-QA0830]